MTDQAYPLAWPEGWPRTKNPRKSSFKSTLTQALRNVEKSLELFAKDTGKKVENITISSNVTLGKLNPEDPGVVVSFLWDGLQSGYPVDMYDKVQDNLQAIHHCIEAERTKHRHGGLNMVRAALAGSLRLPGPDRFNGQWWVVLGVPKTASERQVKLAYKRLCSTNHPDNGGDATTFQNITKAYKQYQQEREES